MQPNHLVGKTVMRCILTRENTSNNNFGDFENKIHGL